jgi:hypothetical protein
LKIANAVTAFFGSVLSFFPASHPTGFPIIPANMPIKNQMVVRQQFWIIISYICRMKKLLLLSLVFGAGLLFNSCKTDFETVAPYKEMISVYGLVEHQNGTNTIRLNRVFLTDGNAYTTAGIDDSVNYKAGELTVKLEKYRDANLTSTFVLTETVTTLPTGTFNANQRLWVCNNQLASFGTGGTDNNYTISYKLKIHNNNTGKDFEATTKLIRKITFPLGTLNNPPNYPIDMTNPTYPRTLKWISPQYAKTTNLTLRFHYKEYPTSDLSVWNDKYVDWKFNDHSIGTPSATNNQVSNEFYGLDFYNFLKSAIPDDNSIYAREAGQLEAIVTAVGEEFQLFNDVNSPSNSIVQEKPIYTNVTDGVGVFSSRTKESVFLNLTNFSVDKLAAQDYPTCGKKFFDSNGTLGFGCQ